MSTKTMVLDEVVADVVGGVLPHAEHEQEIPGLAALAKDLRPAIFRARKKSAEAVVATWDISRRIYRYVARPEVVAAVAKLTEGRRGRPRAPHRVVTERLAADIGISPDTILAWMAEWSAVASSQKIAEDCADEAFSGKIPEKSKDPTWVEIARRKAPTTELVLPANLLAEVIRHGRRLVKQSPEYPPAARVQVADDTISATVSTEEMTITARRKLKRVAPYTIDAIVDSRALERVTSATAASPLRLAQADLRLVLEATDRGTVWSLPRPREEAPIPVQIPSGDPIVIEDFSGLIALARDWWDRREPYDLLILPETGECLASAGNVLAVAQVGASAKVARESVLPAAEIRKIPTTFATGVPVHVYETAEGWVFAQRNGATEVLAKIAPRKCRFLESWQEVVKRERKTLGEVAVSALARGLEETHGFGAGTRHRICWDAESLGIGFANRKANHASRMIAQGSSGSGNFCATRHVLDWLLDGEGDVAQVSAPTPVPGPQSETMCIRVGTRTAYVEQPGSDELPPLPPLEGTDDAGCHGEPRSDDSDERMVRVLNFRAENVEDLCTQLRERLADSDGPITARIEVGQGGDDEGDDGPDDDPDGGGCGSGDEEDDGDDCGDEKSAKGGQ